MKPKKWVRFNFSKKPAPGWGYIGPKTWKGAEVGCARLKDMSPEKQAEMRALYGKAKS